MIYFRIRCLYSIERDQLNSSVKALRTPSRSPLVILIVYTVYRYVDCKRRSPVGDGRLFALIAVTCKEVTAGMIIPVS
jgi:hypothetical protein